MADFFEGQRALRVHHGEGDEKSEREYRKRQFMKKREKKIEKKKEEAFEKEMKSMMKALVRPGDNFKASDSLTKDSELAKRTYGLMSKQEFQDTKKRIEEEEKEEKQRKEKKEMKKKKRKKQKMMSTMSFDMDGEDAEVEQSTCPPSNSTITVEEAASKEKEVEQVLPGTSKKGDAKMRNDEASKKVENFNAAKALKSKLLNGSNETSGSSS
mmetsp:Transcript_32866/g.51577  ORF Transcript_32866/g.51577 Transcript_32866/m.51577 type:complete len:212 (+) Transcript_32866:51-686(+)|eukprot:CAMPEP_0194710840 /NCGR_PEP_ID=MMETSP0296-20130528/3332_1 /TAXON_ID=39354 /ORGANISM="Heterosigma akashiwo, Strain CCMP2393" /LENGTH=211 /DNA_ID=CAMNT_0039608695 /DNA_START=14 /DNA_END=649 /DNA_ORIENTATION=-